MGPMVVVGAFGSRVVVVRLGSRVVLGVVGGVHHGLCNHKVSVRLSGGFTHANRLCGVTVIHSTYQ